MKTLTKTAVLGSLAMAPYAAMAALPDTVKTSLDAAKADGMEAGWLIVGIFAAIFVIKLVKRFL